jgi:hypothetical protein
LPGTRLCVGSSTIRREAAPGTTVTPASVLVDSLGSTASLSSASITKLEVAALGTKPAISAMPLASDWAGGVTA